jgi:hypothetical protein
MLLGHFLDIPHSAATASTAVARRDMSATVVVARFEERETSIAYRAAHRLLGTHASA